MNGRETWQTLVTCFWTSSDELSAAKNLSSARDGQPKLITSIRYNMRAKYWMSRGSELSFVRPMNIWKYNQLLYSRTYLRLGAAPPCTKVALVSETWREPLVSAGKKKPVWSQPLQYSRRRVIALLRSWPSVPRTVRLHVTIPATRTLKWPLTDFIDRSPS
jgi:hypothetical protein